VSARRRYGVLTTSYPHAHAPIAGCFVREMNDALRARGHAVTTVCVARRDGAGWDAPLGDAVRAARYPLGETFYGAGAPDALSLGGGELRWRAWAGAPFALASLASAMRALDDCDVLLSHFVIPCGLLAGLRRRGRPHVAIAHGTDGWLLARAPASLQSLALRGVDTLWCTHHALRERLRLPASVRAVVRPMGWSPFEVARTASPTLRLLVLSRLVPVKRVDRAITAVRILRARGRDVSLTIAGDGPDRASLEAQAGAGVRFLGAVAPADRGRLFAEADVLLHPAGPTGGRTEGAPVAVLEAMGHGLAVVACDAGGVRELTGDTARLVPADASPEALAGAIEGLTPSVRAEFTRRALARALPWRWDATAAWVEGLTP
jgi:glycosyltransferase involved in cell wall biosynthesis